VRPGRVALGAGLAYLAIGVWRYVVGRRDADAARRQLAALPPGPPGSVPPPSPASVVDPSPLVILTWPKQISLPTK
jgi:hypothetical protein